MQEVKMSGESLNIEQENISKLKEIFPEVFNEDKIDFDKLQNVLGNYIDTDEEKYRFTWNGKMNALRLSQTPSIGTLRPCKEESKDWDTTQNLYIEGDNLEVLKLLQNSYLNKIKMIYIDPPYNTGNDFVYADDFKDNIGNYKKITGQVDTEGNATSTNKDSDGRYHTNWLNMMYPRLRLARNLLSEDGVIFISIDDNELTNLKKICDEIFGEENFLTCITRGTGTPTGGGNSSIVNELDYILVFAKNWKNLVINGLPMSEEDMKIYDQKDEYGTYLIRPLRRTGGEDRREDRPSMYFPIKAPDGTLIYPIGPTGYDSRWICGESTFYELEKNHRIQWKKVVKDGVERWNVYQKFYVENRTKAPGNLWFQIEGNKKATRDCRDLFDGEKVFDYPKPIEVLEKLILMGTNKNDIILDFFAGSSTIAQSCMNINQKFDLNLKYINVQIPQVLDKNNKNEEIAYKFLEKCFKPTNICEIGKERIRRAGNKIKQETDTKNQQLKLGEEFKQAPDIGFKVFKLDSSNIRKWNLDTQNIEQALLDQINNFVDGRTEEDALYEIILKNGLPLTVPVEELDIKGKKVYSIGMGALIVCLDNNITLDIADEIANISTEFEDKSQVTVVFKDNGFANDSVKTNIKETIRGYGIGKFVTV